MELREKEVDFTKCNKCKFKDKREDDYDSPCPECLDNFTNIGTTDPINFTQINQTS